jgi:hypothetical protein
VGAQELGTSARKLLHLRRRHALHRTRLAHLREGALVCGESCRARRVALAHNGTRKRMAGGGFNGGCELQHVLRRPPSVCMHGHYAWRALGERAGLVKHDGVNAGHALDDVAAADKQSTLGRCASAHQHRGGRGETQRTGARNHEHVARELQR